MQDRYRPSCEVCGRRMRKNGYYYHMGKNSGRDKTSIYECRRPPCNYQIQQPSKIEKTDLALLFDCFREYLEESTNLKGPARRARISVSTFYLRLRQASRIVPDCIELSKELRLRIQWKGILGMDVSHYGHAKNKSEKIFIHLIDVLTSESIYYKLRDWDGSEEKYRAMLIEALWEIKISLNYMAVAICLDRGKAEREAARAVLAQILF